jgi:hypothetical protein
MNKLSQQELWENIQKFNLDDPHSNFPFSKKLAKENNWSASFTAKAIEEYKKFIYLCCISPTGASPSDIVDEVWHMHLTYTSSYWIDFCRNTLQKDIHHHPSKGGVAETEKHKNWYTGTLVLYEETFGTKPPNDIWPLYDEQEINEPVYTQKTVTNTVLLFFITAVSFIAVTNMFQLRGEDFLYYYPALAAIGLGFMLYQLNEKSKRLQQIVSSHMPANFTKWQAIKFLRGPHGCYQAALIELIRNNKVAVQGKNFCLISSLSDTAVYENPVWEKLTQDIAVAETFSYERGFAALDQEKLKHPGFEKLFRLSKKIDYQKFFIPGFILLAGIARVLQGLANDKPVSYLVTELMLTGFVLVAINELYSYTKLVFKKVNEYWAAGNELGYSKDLAVNYSILGIMAVSGFAEYTILNNIFTSKTPQRNDGSSSSGCSSCTGGSSCGSGCGGGGCGGCGGGD